jgi:hypothetical protein
MVNLSDFYSYRLIGKLTAVLQLQEFCQRNQIVDSSTTAERISLTSSKALSIYMGHPSLQEHILTHHTRKRLVY